jgi:hypothetical protein
VTTRARPDGVVELRIDDEIELDAVARVAEAEVELDLLVVGGLRNRLAELEGLLGERAQGADDTRRAEIHCARRRTREGSGSHRRQLIDDMRRGAEVHVVEDGRSYAVSIQLLAVSMAALAAAPCLAPFLAGVGAEAVPPGLGADLAIAAFVIAALICHGRLLSNARRRSSASRTKARTSRSCRSAAARVRKVPRLRRRPVLGSGARE